MKKLLSFLLLFSFCAVVASEERENQEQQAFDWFAEGARLREGVVEGGQDGQILVPNVAVMALVAGPQMGNIFPAVPRRGQNRGNTAEREVPTSPELPSGMPNFGSPSNHMVPVRPSPEKARQHAERTAAGQLADAAGDEVPLSPASRIKKAKAALVPNGKRKRRRRFLFLAPQTCAEEAGAVSKRRKRDDGSDDEEGGPSRRPPRRGPMSARRALDI